MTIDRLTTREDFERCIAANADDPIFLLKHSTTWPISAGARSEFLRFAASHPDVRCVEVHVREDRPLSLAVAESTGVEHQSPQVICLRGGRASWHASHHAITARALAEHAGGRR